MDRHFTGVIGTLSLVWAGTLAAQVAARGPATLPVWVLNPPRQAGALFGVGAGASLEAADNAARLELAKQLRVSVSEAFQLWEREATAPEQRELDVHQRVRVGVDSTELPYVEIYQRFVDGQTFYSLARVDLLRAAAEVGALLDRSSGLVAVDYGEALRLALRAGELAPLLEFGGGPFDSLAIAARSQARALLVATRLQITPGLVEWGEERSGPLRLKVMVSVNGRPAGLPIRAQFVRGAGIVRISPALDSVAARSVDILTVSRARSGALLRVALDLDALVSPSRSAAETYLAAPAAEVEVRTPETRVGVVGPTARDCFVGELARAGYTIEPLQGTPSSPFDWAQRSGVQVLVDVGTSVSDLWPITITRQQAAASVRVMVYNVQRQATAASLTVAGLRGTGPTAESAREAAVQRACREAAARLLEIVGWDVP